MAAYSVEDAVTQTTSSPYDTAAVAMLDGDPQLIGWLLNRQHEDGSWGGQVAFASDRLLQTLMVTRTLLSLPQHELAYSLEQPIAQATAYLSRALGDWDDVAISECDLAGFELLVPTHLRKLYEFGLLLPELPPAIHARWQRKLAVIPDNAFAVPAFSQLWHAAEFLEEQRGREEATHQLASTISPLSLVGSSPSATAYLLRRAHLPTSTAQALSRLLFASRNADGGYSSTTPLDSFTGLWSIYFTLQVRPEQSAHLIASFDRLLAAHDLRLGVGGNPHFAPDADDTAVAAYLAVRFGRLAAARTLSRVLLDHFYRQTGHFHTYQLEVTGSLTTNAHAISALVLTEPLFSDPAERARMVAARQQATLYLLTQPLRDKWHVSPYYTLLAISAAFSALPLAEQTACLLWQDEQRARLLGEQLDGGWGVLGRPSREETAYALLTLLTLPMVPTSTGQLRQAIINACTYLRTASTAPLAQTELWIDKTLYQPPRVVGCVIDAAWLAAERWLEG